MRKFGETLKSARIKKRISLKSTSKNLHIKVEHLRALEEEDWAKLPEPAFTRGFVASYAKYLGQDPSEMLALFRREYDEKNYQKKKESKREIRLNFTPARIINYAIIFLFLVFFLYIFITYSSILKSPKVELVFPKEDITVSTPAIVLEGKTESGSTVALNGEFIPVDENGNFSYQLNLEQGRNEIELIASKRLSPKTKIQRTVRLIR